MFERTMEKISDLGYEISWRYEPSSNSVIIRACKDDFVMEKKVDLEFGMYAGGGAGFEFYMNLYLIVMLAELEDRE